MTKVTFKNTSTYQHKPVVGEFTVIKEFTLWGGRPATETTKRRQGNNGRGYVKVSGVHPIYGDARPFKVTINSVNEMIPVTETADPAMVALMDEIEQLKADKAAAAPGSQRSAIQKRIKRREAKLAEFA